MLIFSSKERLGKIQTTIYFVAHVWKEKDVAQIHIPCLKLREDNYIKPGKRFPHKNLHSMSEYS
jgi:hypothetical protein